MADTMTEKKKAKQGKSDPEAGESIPAAVPLPERYRLDVPPPAAEGRASPSARVARWPLVAAAVVTVVALALAAVEWRRANDAVSDRDAAVGEQTVGLAVAQVASDFSETLLTYDSANPSASMDHLRDLATDASRAKIDESRGKITANPAEPLSLLSQVDNVYLRGADGDAPEAIVAVTSQMTARGQTVPVAFYVRLELRRQDNDWRVEKVNDIVGPLLQASQGSTSTTTTTTAP